MSSIDDINPVVLTGQGLPDSNPFKVEEEDDEESSADAFAEKKRKKVQEELRRTDYIDDLLEKSEMDLDDTVVVDEDYE